MTTEYQKQIMELGNITFENIEDKDIITFEDWEHPGVGGRSIFYLHKSNGRFKDCKIGNLIPDEANKYKRPYQKISFKNKSKSG